MNSEDEYQLWIEARRTKTPPAALTDRIMLSVRERDREVSTTRSPESGRETVLQRAIPWLVLSAAAIVLTVRVFSIVSLLVVPSSIADVTMIEPLEEESHEP
jgi:hypothetical protein